MAAGSGIAIGRSCLLSCRTMRPLVSSPAAPSLLFTRCYKFKRSFLSDEAGVDDFIALLGDRERQLLHDGLSRTLKDAPAVVADNGETDQSPTVDQLKLVFVHQMLPFVGFGFLDNLIMILAGEYLDVTIGVTLGISTMAAAGLGNALSDVAGIGSAWYVEKLASSVGIQHPNLSKAQLNMTSTKFTTQSGRAIGILIGCIVGMFPLLFMHNPRAEAKKEEDGHKSSSSDSKDVKN